MKKSGWGLRAELLFILLFLICIVVATIGLNQLGMFDRPVSKENIYKPDNDDSTYVLLEGKLSSAAKDYVVDKYGIVEDNLTIKYSTLYYNNYINKLEDNSERSCSGYVEVVITNESVVYYPYIKCKGYKTPNYDSSKDW